MKKSIITFSLLALSISELFSITYGWNSGTYSSTAQPSTYDQNNSPVQTRTKFFWYPDRGAFRAGVISNNFWDYTSSLNNLGDFSVAFGYNSIAKGKTSFAMGEWISGYGIPTNATGEAFSEEFRTSRLKINRLPKKDGDLERKPMVALRLPGQLDWTCVYCLHSCPSLLTLCDFPESLRKREGLQFETAKILPSDSVVNPLTSNPKNPIKRILLEPGRQVPAALQPVLEELVLEAPQIITIQDRYLVSMAANVDSLKKFLGLLADAFGKLKKEPPRELRLVAGPPTGHGGVRQRQEWQSSFKQVEQQLKLKQNAFWSKVKLDFRLREFSRGAVRDYHDRQITAESSSEKNGKVKGQKLIIEMTGGIDILMDERETTRIFLCRPST